MSDISDAPIRVTPEELGRIAAAWVLRHADPSSPNYILSASAELEGPHSPGKDIVVFEWVTALLFGMLTVIEGHFDQPTTQRVSRSMHSAVWGTLPHLKTVSIESLTAHTTMRYEGYAAVTNLPDPAMAMPVAILNNVFNNPNRTQTMEGVSLDTMLELHFRWFSNSQAFKKSLSTFSVVTA